MLLLSRQMPDNGAMPGFVPMHLRSINREAAFRSGMPDGAQDRASVDRGSRSETRFPTSGIGACQRRRDVLMILASVLVSTGLIAIIPAAPDGSGSDCGRRRSARGLRQASGAAPGPGGGA